VSAVFVDRPRVSGKAGLVPAHLNLESADPGILHQEQVPFERQDLFEVVRRVEPGFERCPVVLDFVPVRAVFVLFARPRTFVDRVVFVVFPVFVAFVVFDRRVLLRLV
jgi:hypothetical protein